MNTEIKHTPGPWKVKHSESNPAFNVIGTVLGGKYKIARCPYTTLPDGEPVLKDETEANAHLIASAPDLLAENAELKQLIGELSKWVEDLIFHRSPSISKGKELLTRAKSHVTT